MSDNKLPEQDQRHSSFNNHKGKVSRRMQEETLLFAARRDMARLWREGWKFAAPYLATANGALGLVAFVGIGLGTLWQSKMQAIQVSKCGGPEVLSLVRNLPKPVPKSGELLVKVQYAGVNFIDTYHRSGLYQMPLPFIPGREGSGIVESADDNSAGYKVGDRVAFIQPGTYSDYCCPSVAKCIKVPDSVPMDVAGASLLAGLTGLMLTQETYQVKRGDFVLIHAIAGGVGQILCQLCKNAGATVLGTTSCEEKADIAKQLGADHIIDYTKQNVEERVRELTGGKGVNVVYDGVGKATFDISLSCLKPHGWMITFGNASGKPEPFDVLRLSKGSVKLMRPTLFDFISIPEDFQRLSKQLMQLIESGKLKINIFKTYPIANAAQAHIDLEGRVSTGKLVIQV